MAKKNPSEEVGPLWAARLAVILIVLVVVSAGVAMFFAARGPR